MQGRKPTKIICVDSNSERGVFLHFQVLTEHDDPVRGAIIRIFRDDLKDGYVDLVPTDSFGVSACYVRFSDVIISDDSSDYKYFSCRVLGSSVYNKKDIYKRFKKHIDPALAFTHITLHQRNGSDLFQDVLSQQVCFKQAEKKLLADGMLPEEVDAILDNMRRELAERGAAMEYQGGGNNGEFI